MWKGSDAHVEQLDKLASWAAGLSYDSIPEEVKERARLVFADSIGVAIRGSRTREAKGLRRRYLPGSASLLGPSSETVDTHSAAFNNSFAMGSIEMDEGSRPSGHPGLHIVPPLLAAAERDQASGRDLLTALVAGYEVQARIQWATTLRPSVHPHGNFGHVGAAAALARLDNRPANEMSQAMLVSAGLAGATAWSAALEGHAVRNAFAAQSGLTALRVGDLVSAGVTGFPSSIEETFGNLLGSEFNTEVLAQELGRKYFITSNFFKFHSSVVLAHPVIDAVAAAFGAEPMSGEFPLLRIPDNCTEEHIAQIRVRVPQRAKKLDIKEPLTPLGARFSIPFIVGAFLRYGSATPEVFEDHSLQDRSTRAVAQRVAIEGAADLEERWPRELVAEVEIRFNDGSVREGYCSNPIGSTAETITRENLKAKFAYLASTAGLEEATDAWERLSHPDSVASLGDASLIWSRKS